MYKEKHILNKHTAGHKLSRYLDVYELNTVNCSADKTTGYKGDTITITGTPAWNEKTSSYSVTGATLTGNQFDFTGSDVTAQANYETAKSITTQNCSANKVSGFSGDNVTVTGTPAWNQKLSGYGITGATLTGNNFKIANSNVTVQGKYETAKNVTLQTDGRGSIAANKTSGFIGDSVTLSNTANAGYEFSAYTLTGANLTGSTFNFTGSNVTAKAWFKVVGTPIVDITGYSADVDLGEMSTSNYGYIAFMFDQYDRTVYNWDTLRNKEVIQAHLYVNTGRDNAYTQCQYDPTDPYRREISGQHTYMIIHGNRGYEPVPIADRAYVYAYNLQYIATDKTDLDNQWHTYKYIIHPDNRLPGVCDMQYSAYKDYVPMISGLTEDDAQLALWYKRFTFNVYKGGTDPVVSNDVKNLKVSYFNTLADAEAWRM